MFYEFIKCYMVLCVRCILIMETIKLPKTLTEYISRENYKKIELNTFGSDKGEANSRGSEV